MTKQILIVDTSLAKHQFLAKIFHQLTKHDYWFLFWGKNNNLSQEFRANHWPTKIKKHGWLLSKWLLVARPVWWCQRLLRLWSYQQLYHVKTLVCLHWPE